MNEKMHCSMLIQWSDEDQTYLAILPEWAEAPHLCRSVIRASFRLPWHIAVHVFIAASRTAPTCLVQPRHGPSGRFAGP